jgi:hypothetical protein
MYTIEDLKLAKARFELECAMRRALLGLPVEPADPHDRWLALVAAKVAGGLSRVSAIQAVAKEQPDLYQAQSVHKSEFRAH